MIKKPFFFILLGVLLIGLLSAAGCGGGVISAPPANRTETPLPSPTPTPTPTLLPGPAATPTAQISPTPSCGNLELELDYQQVQQAEGFYALLTARGSIPLTVQFQQSPRAWKGSARPRWAATDMPKIVLGFTPVCLNTICMGIYCSTASRRSFA